MKRTVSFLLLILILANMAFIFYNSSQSASVSNERSKRALEFILDIPDRIKSLSHFRKEESVPADTSQSYTESNNPKNNTEKSVERKLNRLNKELRSYCHMIEYSFLGLLLAMFFVVSLSLKNKRYISYVLSLFICFIYAVSDEYHQIFVDGRDFQVDDINLDVVGAVFGIVIALSFCASRKKGVFKDAG